MYKLYYLLQNATWFNKEYNNRLHYFNGIVVYFAVIHNLTSCASVRYNLNNRIQYHNSDWIENTRKG